MKAGRLLGFLNDGEAVSALEGVSSLIFKTKVVDFVGFTLG